MIPAKFSMLPILPFALVLSLSASPSPSQDEEGPGDVVFLRKGQTESGRVLEETVAGLALKPDEGQRKTIAWDTVLGIQYGDAPDEFARAQAALESGNLELALGGFQQVLAGEDVRPVIRQHALFHGAYAQKRLGLSQESRASYAQLLEDFPQGRFVRLAGESLIDLCLQAGDAAGARKTLDDIAAGLGDAEGGAAVVGLLEADLLAASGKSDEAGQRYGAVEGMSGAGPAAAQEARLGRARLLLAAGKGAEAEPILRGLVGESESARVQSGAWNALGEILATEGRARKEADRILDALYAYLRTVVQYKPLPGESTLEYERALSGAGTCFQYLSELEPSAEKKRALRDHHRQRLDQLQREFPNSAFLKKD